MRINRQKYKTVAIRGALNSKCTPVIKPSARALDIVNTVLGFNVLWQLF